MIVDKRVPLESLKEFVYDVLKNVNANHDQTRIFADALIWSDLIGRPTHGVWRLPAYTKRMEMGLIKCPCEPVYSTPDSAAGLMDGDEGIGHYVGHEAMMQSIERAKTHGLGAIGVHNSNHFGTGAYYVNIAAEQGMIGFAFSNSISKVAPYGGVSAVFGTNPFAFGAPRKNRQHMMLDMATTAIAGAQVMKYAEQGKELPEGIAIDPAGTPITDPNKVGDGALLPFGGAKGYGLSLMIEVLSSVLTGAMSSSSVNSMFNNFSESGRNGHFFLALDIEHFMPLDQYFDRMEFLIDEVKAAAINSGDVMIPGETRWQVYEQSLAEGVQLDAATVKALDSLADQHQLGSLFQNDTVAAIHP